MLTIRQDIGGEIPIIPTIFPDNTSQVWKLPEDVLLQDLHFIDWRFEHEREIWDLYSIVELLRHYKSQSVINLHVPYLPFARQDKVVSNCSTFNFTVFARLINGLNLDRVTAVDAHNPALASKRIRRFVNWTLRATINELLESLRCEIVVFPDKGAQSRYAFAEELNGVDTIVCEKVRDQSTGRILSHDFSSTLALTDEKVFVIDDICDGGATFIGIGNKLKERYPQIELHLYVSHGIFSKGKQVLYDAGYDFIHTTNSLPKNKEGIPV